MELFTPEDFRTQRNNYLGSAWGVEPRLTQTASFRPANRSEDIRRLYLVGASTHPGARGAADRRSHRKGRSAGLWHRRLNRSRRAADSFWEEIK